jgi:lipid II:glycine glycyltransferase (peptidoglycan interpeptide bridge formation enzyme)
MNGKGDKPRFYPDDKYRKNFDKIFGDKKLTKKEQKELDNLLKEITEEAKKVVEDYTKNPSELSGSITQVHESSPYVATREERLFDTTGKSVKFEEDDN